MHISPGVLTFVIPKSKTASRGLKAYLPFCTERGEETTPAAILEPRTPKQEGFLILNLR